MAILGSDINKLINRIGVGDLDTSELNMLRSSEGLNNNDFTSSSLGQLQNIGIGAGPETDSKGLLSWLGDKNNLGNLVGALQAIGGLYGGYKQYQLGKKSINMQRDAFNTNLANQTQDYNTKQRSVAKLDAERAGYERGSDEFNKFAEDSYNKRKLERRTI